VVVSSGHDVVLLVGGDPVPPAFADELPREAFIIAADSGLHLAATLGRSVDLLVGDLDSVDPDAIAAAEASGTRVERHPIAKNATDLALALDAAIARRPGRITVVGGAGGRLDHELAIWLLLAAEAYAGVRLRAWSCRARIEVVRPDAEVELAGSPGELVSLLPVHGVARQVTTTGLIYPLSGEDLPPGSTRGVSNQLAAPRAGVRLTGGVLLAVQLGELGPPLPPADHPGP
jgi:thiamine pyrophosphokinase